MKTHPIQHRFFKTAAYATTADTRRFFVDRLFPTAAWYFYYRYFRQVVSSSIQAKRGLYDTANWAGSSYAIIKIIEGCGGRFIIEGLEHLGPTQPVVFVANHMSTLETMVLPGIIAPVMETTFVVKESLLNMPFFGAVLRARNPIAVKRANPRDDLVQVLEQGAAHLKAGRSVVIFPQGGENTRVSVFNPGEFNSLGMKLAKRAGVPVIPIALKTDFWGIGRVFRDIGPLDRRKTVHFAFGAPIAISGNGRAEHEQVIAFIAAKLQSWSAE